MPEPAELLLRGGERRRVTVTERDDCDPGAEVEVLAAVRVPDPRPLASSDRQIRPGVCRQQPIDAL
jgi:hypothetical protein